MKIITDNNKYSVLYNTNVNFIIKNKIVKITSADIVSMAYICNYDTMTYPIFRIRIYSDLNIITELCDNPDDINVKISMDGNIYRMSENGSPVPVAAASSISFQLKGYIENKNIPTSTMDLYKDGIKIKNDMNNNIKYPIEVYCYNYDLIHSAKAVTQSIYKNMSLDTAIKDMFARVQNEPISLDPIDNHTKYKQILIPSLNLVDSLVYLELYYGLYKKGAQVFGDIDKTYVCSIDTSSIPNNVLPIYVSSGNNNSDVSGLKKDNLSSSYKMCTLASNVSITTESDIEKVMNGSYVASIDYKDNKLNIEAIDKFKEEKTITVPHTLHQYNNDFIAGMQAARINERITTIDVAGVGYDVFSMKINSRYNFIFESPMRGFDINKLYRPCYGVHIFTNMDADLFIAESTFTMCTN